MAGVPGITTEDQVRFQPPDDVWQSDVSKLRINALNVYLVDIRERRELRSNESVTGMGPQGPTRTPEPARVDCHYLVSAWSPAGITPRPDSGSQLGRVRGFWWGLAVPCP